ncbi:MAG: M48 family metalloprotease, partial [Desulfobacterales bacterium]
MYQKPFFWICLFVLCIVWYSPVSGKKGVSFDAKAKESIINGVLGKNLLVMPQLNKLNFGFGRQKGIEYLYRKTVSKIFFQDKPLEARVIDVIIESPDITLELSHPIFGTGLIKFFFSEDLLEQTTVGGIRKILLETLGDENHQYVFVNPQSKLYHLWSCNHISDSSQPTGMRREDAEANGYRASAFCFTKKLYLPDYSLEAALEREWTIRLGDNASIIKDTKKQVILNEVGQKVLQNWPAKQIGYHYTFHLSDSRRIDAFAIPTGKIIITTALFDSLESQDELEALLVYSIAHVEQRHSLKEYYSCLEDEEYADTMRQLAAAAGSLAGPASGVISGALTAALPEASCNPQSLGGYQKEYVQEADSMTAFYFDVHGKDKGAIVSLLKKLQFSELSEKLHPDLGLVRKAQISYNDRIKRVENTRFVHFKKGR